MIHTRIQLVCLLSTIACAGVSQAQDALTDTPMTAKASALVEAVVNRETRKVLDIMVRSRRDLTTAMIEQYADRIYADCGRLRSTVPMYTATRSYITVPIILRANGDGLLPATLELRLDLSRHVAGLSLGADQMRSSGLASRFSPKSREIAIGFTRFDPEGEFANLAAAAIARDPSSRGLERELQRETDRFTPDFNRQLPYPTTVLALRLPPERVLSLFAESWRMSTRDIVIVDARFIGGQDVIFDVEFDGDDPVSLRYSLSSGKPLQRPTESPLKVRLQRNMVHELNETRRTRDSLTPFAMTDNAVVYDRVEVDKALQRSIEGISGTLSSREVVPIRATFAEAVSAIPRFPLRLAQVTATDGTKVRSARAVVSAHDVDDAFGVLVSFARRYIEASNPAPDVYFSSEPSGANVRIQVGKNELSERHTRTDQILANVWIAKYDGEMAAEGRKPVKFILDLYNDPSTRVICQLAAISDAGSSSCTVGAK
jgi:hypothetical protein